MNTVTIEVSEETKKYLDMYERNSDVNIQDFVDNTLIDAINDAVRLQLGGVFASPLPKKEGEKTLTEVLFEGRRNGEI